jgi:hypothetical protein
MSNLFWQSEQELAKRLVELRTYREDLTDAIECIQEFFEANSRLQQVKLSRNRERTTRSLAICGTTLRRRTCVRKAR